MPTTRTAIREGNTSEYKQALMDEIYEAMRETIATKEGDRLSAEQPSQASDPRTC